jgi:hypothetical protein
MDASKPRLLDDVRERIRLKHYSIRTEAAYVDWIRRFIRFHNRRHPSVLNATHVTAFLTHLAVVGKVAASTPIAVLTNPAKNHNMPAEYRSHNCLF